MVKREMHSKKRKIDEEKICDDEGGREMGIIHRDYLRTELRERCEN